MTRTSSDTWSEERGAGADILDLDRYMRTTRPARRAAHKNGDELVVDPGGLCRAPPRDDSASSDSESDAASAAASAASRQHKRFSHDSGLSDTSYRHKRPPRIAEQVEATTDPSNPQVRSQRSRRSKTGTQAGSRSGPRSRAGTVKRHGSSGSSHTFRATLEQALRDQQAQIARVAQMCEQQARARSGERRGERSGERSAGQARARSGKRSAERSGERRGKRPERPVSASRRTRTRTPTESSFSSSSSSTRDTHKPRGKSTDCRTYKIIMSKLDELNRMFLARRAQPPAPLAPAPRALRRASSGSVTVSDKVVGTDAPRKTQVRGAGAAEEERGAGRGGACVVAYALSVDIPPRPNVVTESVVHSDEAPDETAPGGFHLDDPVRLYKQAKRLEAAHPRRASSSGSSPRGSSRASCKHSCKSSCKGSCKTAQIPSLCALCRCYWNVVRRYVTTQLSAVRE